MIPYWLYVLSVLLLVGLFYFILRKQEQYLIDQKEEWRREACFWINEYHKLASNGELDSDPSEDWKKS